MNASTLAADAVPLPAFIVIFDLGILGHAIEEAFDAEWWYSSEYLNGEM